MQNVDAVIDKQCQRRNEKQSEALSVVIREGLQSEMSKALTTIQDSIIRITREGIRDSIRENLNQQLTEINSVR